jgi:ribonuclease HI
MKIYCDGSGFNGKVSKFGIITDEGKSSTMVFNQELTNNLMEYSGIVMAAIVASEGDEILSDSQLAVKQINGDWKCKEKSLYPLCRAASALIIGKNLSLKWIPREQNKADKVI